jgi:hypothetical protein
MTMTMTDHASIGAYDQTHLLSATDYYIKTRSSSSLTLGNERGLIEIGQQLKIVCAVALSPKCGRTTLQYNDRRLDRDEGGKPICRCLSGRRERKRNRDPLPGWQFLSRRIHTNVSLSISFYKVNRK